MMKFDKNGSVIMRGAADGTGAGQRSQWSLFLRCSIEVRCGMRDIN